MASDNSNAAAAGTASNPSEANQTSTAPSSTGPITEPTSTNASDRANAASSGVPPTPSASASTSSATTTASMLPRSTANVSNNGAASTAASSSSSSSGSATPTTRTSASSLSSFAVSPRRASSSLADHAQTSLSARPGPTSNRRIRQHNPAPNAPYHAPPASTSLASIDGSNSVPSIFGFYSHGASAASQPASTRPNFLPTWRSSQSTQPHAGGWRLPGTADPYRYVRSHIHANDLNGRSAQRQSDQSSLLASPHLGSTLRPANSRVNAAQSSSMHSSIDSGLLSAFLPAPQPTFEETTTISFTWTISDLHLLREEVEHSPPPSEGGRSVSAGAGKSDVWTSHPTFGDGKWKLELVRTPRSLTDQSQQSNSMELHSNSSQEISAPASTVEPVAVQDHTNSTNAQRDSITILSVYLTALVLDYTHANVEIPASIMVGLRPTRAAVGRRGAENGGWLWRRFYDYTFQKEADLFTCHDLPSVSEMLEDVSIARDDAVALTIQLGLGPGHTRGSSGQLDDTASTRMPIEIDGHHLVPRAVLNSLQGLLDDANTGDVRILVRERGVLLPGASDCASMSDDGHVAASPEENSGRVVPYPVGSSCPVPSQDATTEALSPIEDDPDRIFVRDRVLWAHASVLKSRSDYFATMLGSDFSEGISRSYGAEANSGFAARNVRTLRIPDADFVTTYWFLRYLYTEDIQFADKEDVRSATLDEDWAKGSDLGHLTTGSLSGDAGLRAPQHDLLIDWTPISQLEDFDDFGMERNEAAQTSMSFSMTRGQPSSSPVDHNSYVPLVSPSNATTSGSLRQRSSATGFGAAISASIHAGSRGSTLSPPASPSGAVTTPAPATGAAGKHHTNDESSRGGSSGARRTLSNASVDARPPAGIHDPHKHPCSDPGPASALSIFKLAHRYHMQDLSRLASLHMVATLTPQSAFPMLLATSMYTELHTRIKTYVYQHWHLVSHTEEFERCCDEVSVGMWGADAGKTMRAFVKSLVSPLRAAQS